ncbi:hypothetical protein Noda2021_07360 [Candidatus Dependentiae bacterium Noda2021]|nr:hypothetical protein Noda2021_07360 [Candidatus Dependentiae bacterium Noda2021]
MKHRLLTLLFLIFFARIANAHSVGLLMVATGKYVQFIPQLIESARTYFCKGHDVHYYVFTDGNLQPAPDTTIIFQQRLGWPHDTLKRFSMYASHADQYQHHDYLFALDADMLFVDYVGSEILSDRVATLHPCLVNQRGTYETRSISTACVKADEGTHYFAGGFNGGSSKEFLKMACTITANIEKDLEHGFIALWHDESHLNRYFIDNKPTLILCPDYCYPEGWDLPYNPKLVALLKDHKKFQN